MSPQNPVFDKSGIWIGITAAKKVANHPVYLTAAKDVMEIAEQVRERADQFSLPIV